MAWDWATVTDGASQTSRLPTALRDGYVNVDEMTFEELMAMSMEFAGGLHFHDVRNHPDGNWADLFTTDSTVVMAKIQSLDLRRLESEFLQWIDTGPQAMAEGVYRLATEMDTWFTTLHTAEQESGRALSWKIAELIQQRLASELHNVGNCMQRLNTRQSTNATLDFSRLDPIWGMADETGIRRIAQSTLPASTGGTLETQPLRSAFYAFVHALSYLQTITPRHLQDALKSKNHNPAVGLFMAFLTLFRHAQKHVNSFQTKHLDFYYDRVLKVAPRQHRPDKTHVVFERDAGSQNVLIPQGTEFTAGKDTEGHDLIYVAQDNLVVTAATVQSLHALSLERGPLLSPEKELGFVTRISTNRIPTTDQSAETAGSEAWPLFGADTHTTTSRDADIGFAIASSALFLKEGLRNIEIDIGFSDPTDTDPDLLTLLSTVESPTAFFRTFGQIFRRHLLTNHEWLTATDKENILQKAKDILGDTADNPTAQISRDEIENLLMRDRLVLFYRLLRGMFSVRLTSETGWHQVDDYSIAPTDHQDRPGIKFLLRLGYDVDAIVSYSRTLHGEAWTTTLPVIRFGINPQANVYPYSMFHTLGFQEVVLTATVKGVKNVLAYNNHGRLDPSKPFTPFGALPSTNSYFVIGSYEIAKKTLTDLTVNVHWGEFPRQNGGFLTHYEGYETPYANDCFRADVSIVQDGEWKPKRPDAIPRVALFATEETGERLSDTQMLPVHELHYTKPISPALPEEAFGWDLNNRNGFYKFTLAEPESAFGHHTYPALLTRILSENARRRRAKPIPNPPYTPTIDRLSLDYTARHVITIGESTNLNDAGTQEGIISLHPFSSEGVPSIRPPMPSHSNSARAHCMFPEYYYDGNLFIGLSAQTLAGTLTLLFHLREDSSHRITHGTPDIAWFYLSSDRWERFGGDQVLSDTTRNFVSSGIVTLDVPQDINRDNTIMPNDLFWLKVCTDGNVRSFCNVYSIQTQAVTLNWDNRGNTLAHLRTYLPPGTIQQPMASIPGLRTITQVGASFGGRLPESPNALKTRVSERLRHKQRASSPWDYERLILQRFPHVSKVKCFPHMKTSVSEPCPGNVLIVLVPTVTDDERGAGFTPTINADELNQIRTFARDLSSPFVNVEVRNPAYEHIQVRCTVHFSEGAQRGFFLNQLNRAIIDFISPWHAGGCQAQFGWRIRTEDIKAYIVALDYVDFVTNFSMLHITEDHAGKYSLGDTVRPQQHHTAKASEQPPPSGTALLTEIHPTYPWSLAVPLRRHFLETISDRQAIVAESTGIDELEVGRTFIIPGNTFHAPKK